MKLETAVFVFNIDDVRYLVRFNANTVEVEDVKTPSRLEVIPNRWTSQAKENPAVATDRRWKPRTKDAKELLEYYLNGRGPFKTKGKHNES